MSKVLMIAAIVVGVAAVVLTAGAALGFAPAIAGFLGVSVGTLATITAALGVAAAVLNVAAGLTAPKPGFGKIAGAGTQLDFTADPAAGIPYVMGNARVGEAVIHEASWGDKNRYLGIIGIMSLGLISNYNGFYGDNTQISFPGYYGSEGEADGYYNGWMQHELTLGNHPDPLLSMTRGVSPMPDWGSGHLLSGLSASGLILQADVDNGKIYSGGVPQFTHDIDGVLAYDPRQDSTNGGFGSARPTVESTYGYSENPWVHHGTFAIGRWQNGVRVLGPGVPAASIDWAPHAEAANIADANGWTISGRALSTDNKWQVLQSIAQAGGGYPIPSGAKLACLVNTPRVSLETIEEEHLKGPVSVPQMAMRRDRLNGAIPRYREPSLGWQVVSGEVVRNSAYLTADGGTTKTKEIDLPLVSDKDQAAQLVAYEVANSRERAPIAVELDLYWSQYKMGDCLTLNIPSALLISQKAVIISRELDAASNTVRFEFRTEDDAKHAWALGVAGTAPPPTTVGSDPGAGDAGGGYTLTETQTILRSTYPKLLEATGEDDGTTARIDLSAFSFDYPEPIGDVAIGARSILGLAFATTYYPYADVDAVGDATPTFGATTVYGDSLNSSAHPYRISLGRSVLTPIDGGTTTTGGGTGGGYTGGSGSSGRYPSP